jgi:hypothetical protein
MACANQPTGRESKVDVRMIVEHGGAGTQKMPLTPAIHATAARLPQTEQRQGARVTTWVQTVSESRHALSPAEEGGDRGPSAALGPGLGQQCADAGGRPPVLEPLQGGQRRRHDVIRRGASRCGAPRGERRDVQLVVGTEHERSAQRLPHRVISAAPRHLQRPMQGLVGGPPGDDRRQELDDARARASHGGGTQIERRDVGGGRDR